LILDRVTDEVTFEGASAARCASIAASSTPGRGGSYVTRRIA